MALLQTSIILRGLVRLVQGSFVPFLLATLALALLKYKSKATRGGDGLPPGPIGLPLLGYLPFLGRKPYRTFARLARVHGSVFSLRLGAKRVVVLNGPAAIREALVTKGRAFAGRPSWLLNRVNQGKGLANQQANSTWREHRRFVLSVMRSVGNGRTQMENKVAEEVSFLIEELWSHGGRAVDLSRPVQRAFSNVVCALCFGRRYGAGEPDLARLLGSTDRFFRHLSSASAANFLPLLWHLPLPGHRAVRRAHAAVLGFVGERVAERCRQRARHVRDGGAGPESGERTPDPPRDLIGAYLAEIDRRRDRSLGDDHTDDNGVDFSEDYIKHVVADLFFGATETVKAAVLWMLLTMALHPDVQRRVQAELDGAVGRERRPTLADRPALPYTQAALMEVHRRCSVIPCAIPHVTTEEVELGGHRLPRGTTVTANLYSAHMDPELWPDPDRFCPDRFLDEKGQVVTNHEAYMPFSLGPRSCLGEQLAKCEMFLTFTAVLQRFRLELPVGEPRPSLDGLPGITHLPRLTKLRVIPRK